MLEKANVKRSGGISMGRDGLNNAVVPGYATREQYVKEITVANDGIVQQRPVMAYATGSFPMIQYLDKLGVPFLANRITSSAFDMFILRPCPALTGRLQRLHSNWLRRVATRDARPELAGVPAPGKCHAMTMPHLTAQPWMV